MKGYRVYAKIMFPASDKPFKVFSLETEPLYFNKNKK